MTDPPRPLAKGEQICPVCGDRLPVELTRFSCVGRGHHVAVMPTLYPVYPRPIEVERGFAHARQNLIWSATSLVVLVCALWLFSVCQAPRPPEPRASTPESGAS